MTAREQKAKALYDACPTPKPDWEKLGLVTRSVWLDRVPAESPETTNRTKGAAKCQNKPISTKQTPKKPRK